MIVCYERHCTVLAALAEVLAQSAAVISIAVVLLLEY
jgi:hypothetical protein